MTPTGLVPPGLLALTLGYGLARGAAVRKAAAAARVITSAMAAVAPLVTHLCRLGGAPRLAGIARLGAMPEARRSIGRRIVASPAAVEDEGIARPVSLWLLGCRGAERHIIAVSPNR